MTNSWLTLDPVFPLWTIYLFVIPAFGFFLWKEIKRPQKFLPWRLVALLLVFISILGLFLRPAYREKSIQSAILLLTPGYDKMKADSLLRENTSFTVFRTQESEVYPNSTLLTSYHKLSEISPDIKFIIGQGLPDYALELLGDKNYKFIPSSQPYGITKLFIPEHSVINKNSFVKGVLHTPEKTKLKLIGPDGVEDSLVFNYSGEFPFQLSFRPKQAGLFVYRLTYLDEFGKVIDERLPLEITEEQKLKILILQKFPTAELRYLKNYLVERGHALALRYQTSKANFKYEYANTNAIRIDRLSSDVVEAMDLIILDSNVLNELSVSEKSILEAGVKDGLGVIILSDDLSEKDKVINRFLPIAVKSQARDTVHLRFPNSKNYILPIIPVKITPETTIQSIQEHNGDVISGYVYSVAGKVGFQLLKETYRIILEGSEADYSSVWSGLIEKTSRTKNEMFKLKLINSFPYYEDEPLHVEIISSGIQPVLHEGENVISLKEDVIIDDYWHGEGWAGKSGWHQLTTQDSTQLNYFVLRNDEWKSLRIADKLRANGLVQRNATNISESDVYNIKSIPILLFYLIFLFGSGFLWLAPKL